MGNMVPPHLLPNFMGQLPLSPLRSPSVARAIKNSRPTRQFPIHTSMTMYWDLVCHHVQNDGVALNQDSSSLLRLMLPAWLLLARRRQ